MSIGFKKDLDHHSSETALTVLGVILLTLLTAGDIKHPMVIDFK